MESPSGQEQAPGAKRQRKGKNTEPPNEDPDFTHCCIYNVSHADLVVWLNGFSQKDDVSRAHASGCQHNLSFMDAKIDTGPNIAGDFVEAKSGRMMLQRSLCRPKFSSQSKVAEVLERSCSSSLWLPWWTEKDADLKYKYGDLSRKDQTNLGGGLPLGISTRAEQGDLCFDDYHWHPESAPFHEQLRSCTHHGTHAVACFPLLTVTLHKWLTGFNTKTPEEALRAAAAAAAAMDAASAAFAAASFAFAAAIISSRLRFSCSLARASASTAAASASLASRTARSISICSAAAASRAFRSAVIM
mmetsp:Transcript_12057/g.48371  ORF Transcript_12057/g.48371 Transcript_12057/m.48371 type:complete len:302 (-) Transcript_12057:5157-6062(-)